ncbi:hypothetical protein FWH30_00660 [Microgenomates group bacterium]|nr:hypothetical protein [Microgenomates group bacterium]
MKKTTAKKTSVKKPSTKKTVKPLGLAPVGAALLVLLLVMGAKAAYMTMDREREERMERQNVDPVGVYAAGLFKDDKTFDKVIVLRLEADGQAILQPDSQSSEVINGVWDEAPDGDITVILNSQTFIFKLEEETLTAVSYNEGVWEEGLVLNRAVEEEMGQAECAGAK